MTTSKQPLALRHWLVLAALGVPILPACAGEVEDPVARGEAIYLDGLPRTNAFTCASCHAIEEPATDGLRRVGHPIGDAAARSTFKNMQLDELRDAANSCVTEWMRGDALAADDPLWTDLEAFLRSSAPESAPDLVYTITPPPLALDGGDITRGAEIFSHTCAACHGEGAVGTNLAPPLIETDQPVDYIAERVRLSGSKSSEIYGGLIGGAMPFWSAERLSDEELLDIIAYVRDAYVGPDADTGSSEGEDTSGDTSGDTTDGGDCPATHERVGWTAELEPFFHGVGGTAEIIDDCTVQIRNFSYDGAGIDVRVYGGSGGDYNAGYPMTDDLVKSGGYSGETIYARLPEGMTLDELDGVSVWCVDVAVDFGSGLFAAP